MLVFVWLISLSQATLKVLFTASWRAQVRMNQSVKKQGHCLENPTQEINSFFKNGKVAP